MEFRECSIYIPQNFNFFSNSRSDHPWIIFSTKLNFEEYSSCAFTLKFNFNFRALYNFRAFFSNYSCLQVNALYRGSLSAKMCIACSLAIFMIYARNIHTILNILSTFAHSVTIHLLTIPEYSALWKYKSYFLSCKYLALFRCYFTLISLVFP